MKTTRFKSKSNVFIFLAPVEYQKNVTKTLQELRCEHTYFGNGSFEVSYPEELRSFENKDVHRTMIRLCKKVRKALAEAIEKKGYYQKVGGRGKKNKGSFTMSRTEKMIRDLVLNILIPEKNEDTLRSIFSVVKAYFKNVPKKDFVEVTLKKENFYIEVKFKPEFFEFQNLEPATSPLPVVSKTTTPEEQQVEEAIIIREAGIEQALNYNKALKEIIGKLAKTENEIVLHSWYLFFNALVKVLEEENLKLFKFSQAEDGTQSFVGLPYESLKEMAELAVLSEFELKPKGI